jgi:hypothetical protein
VDAPLTHRKGEAGVSSEVWGTLNERHGNTGVLTSPPAGRLTGTTAKVVGNFSGDSAECILFAAGGL